MTSPVVVGIAGTAKNTGKTTALNALLGEAHDRRVPVAVTSIGYDGESIDNVTGLPKPRVVLQPGTIVTTSRACLPRSGWEVVEETEWTTALGQVVIVRCIASGPIVLAGPGTRRELEAIVERMRGLGPALILIDGALNRLAPMSVASSLILSTGAAREADPARLAHVTACMESILALPTLTPLPGARKIPLSIPFASPHDVELALASVADHDIVLALRGPVSPGTLVSLARRAFGSLAIRQILFSDPVAVLLSAEPQAMVESIQACEARGVIIGVERPLTLSCITINPFLPRFTGHGYAADHIPADELKMAMTRVVRAPVVDVMADGAPALWNILRSGPAGPAGL